jgi:hypothetical protein
MDWLPKSGKWRLKQSLVVHLPNMAAPTGEFEQPGV